MTTTETKSLEDFISEEGIGAQVEQIASRPDSFGEEWDAGARHFSVKLYSVKDDHSQTMRVYFSQGSAHTEPPTAADVLDCIASDVAGIENAGSFEDWAEEYGYDTDSRKAYRTYKEIQRQAADLAELLETDEALETLLWNTERL